MATIELVIGGKRFANMVAGLDSVGRGLEDAIDRAVSVEAPPMLLTALKAVANQLRSQHGTAWNGSVFNSSNHLQSRTGKGLASIYRSIQLLERGGTLVSASISAADLSFHEEGGTIRAKAGGYLTIPLPAAMDARGVPLRQRAGQWDNTFVKRSKKGNLLIFRKLPGVNELTPLYILKTSVYIRPRLGMEPTINDQMGYFDTKLFEKISDLIDRYA